MAAADLIVAVGHDTVEKPPFLMRSAGTDSHRVPHTGITRFDDGLTPVPSAALSVPDADQLARRLGEGPAG